MCKLFFLPGKLTWRKVREESDHPTNTAVLHHFLQAFYFFTGSFSGALCLSLLADCLSPWGRAWLFMSGLCTEVGIKQAFAKSVCNLMNELRVLFARTSLWFCCCFFHVTAHVILLIWSPAPLSFKSPDSILIPNLLPASSLPVRSVPDICICIYSPASICPLNPLVFGFLLWMIFSWSLPFNH